MIRKTLSYTLNKEDEEHRIRTILSQRLGVSARFLRSCRNFGDILLNGSHIRTVDFGKEGDRLTLVYPEEKPGDTILPEEMPLRVLYEDEDFLAVQKPAGIPVHPSKGHPSGTLLNGIVYKILNDYSVNPEAGLFEPHLINRLDLGTSGIVLIGKNAYVQEAFEDRSFRKALDKVYLAVVMGNLPDSSGRIELPIGQPDPGSVRRAIVPVSEGGAESVTEYLVLGTGNGYSLVECHLLTGRTHQIRVHLSAIGCPIVGDPLYGSDPATENRSEIIDNICGKGEKPDETDETKRTILNREPSCDIRFHMERQALEAVRLSFVHPVSGNPIVIRSELSPDIRECIAAIGLIPTLSHEFEEAEITEHV